MKTEFHIDRGKLFKAERTPENFLRCYARVSRLGSLKYFNADGSERIEIVEPEVLFSSESMDSARGKPWTLDHPNQKVDSKNVRDYIRGSVSNLVVIDGDFLGVGVTIYDEETIRAIESGEAAEVSAGYDCVTEERDGKYYQTKRIYNHFASVSRGRAGSQVRVQLDSADNNVWISDSPNEDFNTDSSISEHIDSNFFENCNDKTVNNSDSSNLDIVELEKLDNKNIKMTRNFTLDGEAFDTTDLDLAKHAKAVDKELSKLRNDNQELQIKLDEALTAHNDTRAALDLLTRAKEDLQGMCDAMKAEQEHYQGKIKELEDALTCLQNSKTDAADVNIDIEAEINARLDAWDQVKDHLLKIDPEFKADHKLSVLDIRKTYLSKRYPNLNLDNASPEYINGSFSVAIASEPKVEAKADSVETVKTEALGENPIDSILENITANRTDSESPLRSAFQAYLASFNSKE